MLPIHTILHPTDFSERSESAFQLACALTRDYGARLVVLHVAATVPPLASGEALPPDTESQRREAKDHLDRLEVRGADVRAERRLEEGEPVTEIFRVAQEIDASLIVLGTHGRTGLSRLLMGSVAEQVVRKSACPVLTVADPFPGAMPTGASPEGTAAV